MKTPGKIRAAGKRQGGYALLLVLFFLTLLMIATMAASPDLLTQGIREKETETIWRGKQYVRGIKLYYRKTGHFPTSLDDLSKPKTGIRFMRQAYKDPMNPVDGSWRLIYVGPMGQLIGSVKQNQGKLTLPGTAGSGPGLGQLGGSPTQPLGGAQNPLGGQPPSGGLQTGFGGTQPGSGGQPTGTDQGTGTGQPDSSGKTPSPEQILSSMPSTIVGGNIIGVGCKIPKRSVKVYDKGKRYIEWEFYWDPSKDTIQIGQPTTQIGTPLGTRPGAPQNPSPMNPMPQPPNPNPNPPPQSQNLQQR